METQAAGAGPRSHLDGGKQRPVRRGSSSSSNVTLEAEAKGKPAPSPPRDLLRRRSERRRLNGGCRPGQPRCAYRRDRWPPDQRLGSTGNPAPRAGGTRPGGRERPRRRGASRRGGARGPGARKGRGEKGWRPGGGVEGWAGPRLGGMRAGPRRGPQDGPAHVRPQEGAREAGLRPALQMQCFIDTVWVRSSRPSAGRGHVRGGRRAHRVLRGPGQAGRKGPVAEVGQRGEGGAGQLPGIRPGSALLQLCS